jgi:hypothetical protein
MDCNALLKYNKDRSSMLAKQVATTALNISHKFNIDPSDVIRGEQ